MWNQCLIPSDSGVDVLVEVLTHLAVPDFRVLPDHPAGPEDKPMFAECCTAPMATHKACCRLKGGKELAIH